LSTYVDLKTKNKTQTLTGLSLLVSKHLHRKPGNLVGNGKSQNVSHQRAPESKFIAERFALLIAWQKGEVLALQAKVNGANQSGLGVSGEQMTFYERLKSTNYLKLWRHKLSLCCISSDLLAIHDVFSWVKKPLLNLTYWQNGSWACHWAHSARPLANTVTKPVSVCTVYVRTYPQHAVYCSNCFLFLRSFPLLGIYVVASGSQHLDRTDD